MVIEIKGEKLEVFDVHTHMGGGAYFKEWGFEKPSFLGKDFIKGMDEAGVDKVVAFSTAQPITDYSEANRIIVEEAKKNPQRIIGFARVNPNFGPEKTKEIFETYVGKLGMKGIKLHPFLDAFEISSRYMMAPVFEGARKYKVPILIHTGEFYPSPTVVADIASEYPEVSVILAHMGYYQWTEDAIIAAKKQDNIFLDTAGAAAITWWLTRAIRTCGANKVLFGSDFPYLPYESEILKISKFCQAKTDELRLILAENLKKMLRMK